MEDQYYIKIGDEIPDTYCFIYNQKKYPFHYDLFRMSSKYFLKNDTELRNSKLIPLIDPKIESDLFLTEEAIQNFIKYVHRESIPINKENVTQLNFLASKYEITPLINDTKKYMSIHHNELIIDILLIHQNDTSIKTDTFEDILSDNLKVYLKDKRLLKLHVPVLYRILSKFQNKNDQIENDEIIKFLFNCLDEKGAEASVLFSLFDFGKSRIDSLNLLVTKYSNVFDFHFIHSEFLKSFYEQQNEIIKKEAENKIAVNKFMNEMEQLKEVYSKKFNEQKQLNDQLENKISEQNKTIKEIKMINEDYKQKLDNQSNINKELENKITTEIKKLKEKFEQKFGEQNGLIEELKNQIKSKEKTIQNLQSENAQLKKDLINHINKNVKIKEFIYRPNHEFEGIFKYLTDKTGKNIHDNSTIEVTSNSIKSDGRHPKNLLSTSGLDYIAKTGEKYFWICFDFKNMEVEISNYTVKSFTSVPNIGFVKNWVIEISNDGKNWKTIDERSNCSDLKVSNSVHTFSVNPNYFARFCRFRHTGDFWGYSSDRVSGLKSIEFYGRLKITKT